MLKGAKAESSLIEVLTQVGSGSHVLAFFGKVGDATLHEASFKARGSGSIKHFYWDGASLIEPYSTGLKTGWKVRTRDGENITLLKMSEMPIA